MPENPPTSLYQVLTEHAFGNVLNGNINQIELPIVLGTTLSICQIVESAQLGLERNGKPIPMKRWATGAVLALESLLPG